MRQVSNRHRWSECTSTCGCVPDGQNCVRLADDEDVVCWHDDYGKPCTDGCYIDGTHCFIKTNAQEVRWTRLRPGEKKSDHPFDHGTGVCDLFNDRSAAFKDDWGRSSLWESRSRHHGHVGQASDPGDRSARRRTRAGHQCFCGSCALPRRSDRAFTELRHPVVLVRGSVQLASGATTRLRGSRPMLPSVGSKDGVSRQYYYYLSNNNAITSGDFNGTCRTTAGVRRWTAAAIRHTRASRADRRSGSTSSTPGRPAGM